MKRGRRLLCCLLTLLLCFSASPLTVGAAAPTMPDLSDVSAVWFYHLESHRVIVSKNEQTVLPAGSLPKVMAGFLACELLKDRLSESVTVTAEMLETPAAYRQYGLKGETMTVEELFYLALCGSYSDAYDVLAYLAAGSAEAFVERMNARAVELGATNTRFSDPTGVKDSSFTTAEDLFRISLAAVENSLYMRFCDTERCDLFPNPIFNYNALKSASTDSRYYNEKCHGMSAGSTTAGGWSLCTLVRSGNDSYLCVILGGTKGAEAGSAITSYLLANRLISWVYKSYTYLEVINPETTVCKIPVTVSDMVTEVAVRPAESCSFYLPVGTDIGKDVTFSIRLSVESLEAPVREGTPVGYAAIVYEGEILGTVSLFTAEEAERSGFVSRLRSIKSITESRAARAGILFFAVTFTGWIVAETVLLRRRRHRWDRYFSKKLEAPEKLARKDRQEQRNDRYRKR